MANNICTGTQQCEWHMWSDVAISSSCGFGIQVEQPYDPFALYCAWEDKRESSVPPHLAFANLNGMLQIPTSERAVHFLEAYGPLIAPQPATPDELVMLTLPTDEPHGGMLDRAGCELDGRAWVKTDIRSFWREQQRFRAFYLLWLGTRGKTEWADLGDCLAKIGVGRADPKEAVLPAIAAAITRRLASPMVTQTPTSLYASWDCTTLLRAMYAMFYWDIGRGRPIRLCANDRCGHLFADYKSTVRFCTPDCERTTRLRKWWRNNGKQYRQRKRGLSCPAVEALNAV